MELLLSQLFHAILYDSVHGDSVCTYQQSLLVQVYLFVCFLLFYVEPFCLYYSFYLEFFLVVVSLVVILRADIS